MTLLQSFIEVLISIHILLAITSLCIGRHWIGQEPTRRLFLARLFFTSCILSPIAVQFFNADETLLFTKFISTDIHLKASKTSPAEEKTFTTPSKSSSHPENLSPKIMDYWQHILLTVFFLGMFYHGCRLFRDARKIRSLLEAALPYKSKGKLAIKVSDRCFIPFTIRLPNKAYIILPVSLLESAVNTKMAIAHEGQHHRQGDCLWAYFAECIRFFFWENPGVQRWHRFLTELQELACDEALVGHQMLSAHAYGHCLFKVAQTASTFSNDTHRELACAVGMTWNSGNNQESLLTRRITMLSIYQTARSRRSMLNFTLAIAAITAPFCTAYAAKGSFFRKEKSVDTSSMDPRMQKIAEAEIAAAVNRYRAKSGAVAIADPMSGKILAFAEARSFGTGNWASRLIPAASTIKPFIAAAALESKLSSESQVYDCRQPYFVNGTKFVNYNSNFTDVSLTQAIAQSVNICLIKVAQDLGSQKVRSAIESFGFDTSWWRNDRSDALQLAKSALGLNIPVNLETVAKAYAILANKGHTFSENSKAVISEASAEAVTRMLVEAVDNGTGKEAAISGLRVAGKTGTMQAPASFDSPASYLAMFAGYVSTERPRLATFVVIENGFNIDNNERGTGGSLAAPVFHNLAVKILENSQD